MDISSMVELVEMIKTIQKGEKITDLGYSGSKSIVVYTDNNVFEFSVD